MAEAVGRASQGTLGSRGPVNFSRPRPVTPSQKFHRDNIAYGGEIKAFEAFHDLHHPPLPAELPAHVPARSSVRSPVELPADVPVQSYPAELPADVPERRSFPVELPAEPRFSVDSQRRSVDVPTAPIASSSPLTSTAGDSVLTRDPNDHTSKRRPQEYETNQRYAPQSRSAASSTTSTSDSNTSSANKPAATPPTAASLAATLLVNPPRILRRVSVTQHSLRFSASSEHAPVRPASGEWEDNASHHTVSDNGADDERISTSTSSSTNIAGEKWTSSDYDTSALSAAQIKKLKKKGINPALYAEMKAARKGRGKMSPLVGNTFLG